MHPDERDKVVITPDDVAETESPQTIPSRTPTIPLWWRLLSMALVLCPPALFIATIVGLLVVRRRGLPLRYAHAVYYCGLLLVSGTLLMFLVIVFALGSFRARSEPVLDLSGVTLDGFPALPTDTPLSAKDVARQLTPLVVVIQPAHEIMLLGGGQACGAGVVTVAGREGILIVTSRHVMDAMGGGAELGQRAKIVLQDGQSSYAILVGLHNTLDLALLWAKRQGGQSEYVQPLREFGAVEIGEEIFVIGHPQGLEFSLSNGLVAQVRGPDMIQVSAPVSPGNSGGPVFDCNGRLMAVVQGVIDKARSPNAENLNFAVRVDDLLNINEWTLQSEGRRALAVLASLSESEPAVSRKPEASTEEASMSYRR